MNPPNLRTAADIINAFRKCQNAGEQIDLFEALATSNEPPVEEFGKILKDFKLEFLLALTIQAFGNITDVGIKENLKRRNLLEILSEQAQSGQTDLIRWSAATTIEKLGFDFIAVSQHLTVEPKSIAERIMQSKLKRLEDNNLLSSNDIEEYINFWVYSSLHELKIKTVSIDGEGEKYQQLISRIFDALAIRGIRDVNKSLARVESRGDSASKVDENELFEAVACKEAIKQIKKNPNHTKIHILIANQVHCLQSENRGIRELAASTLSKINKSLLDDFNQHYKPNLLRTINLIKIENDIYNNYNPNYSYEQLKNIVNDFLSLLPTLNRKRVKHDCEIALEKLKRKKKKKLYELEQKEKRRLYELEKEKERRLQIFQEIRNLKSNVDSKITKIKSINSLVYSRIIAKNKFKDIPDIDIEKDDRYDVILNDYVQSLRSEASRLQNEVSKFYKDYTKNQLTPLDTDRTKAEANYILINSIYNCLPLYVILSLIIILLLFLYYNLSANVFWLLHF